MTPGEMETVILLLLAVLFLAALVSTIVLVFFRPWLIVRGEQDQHQNLESGEAPEPRGSPESAGEASGSSEAPPDGAERRRSWWRRFFGY